ncbi:tape measure protein [uncultured Prevotella sp.]|jgi:tape measure domain-containing protein|uniref:Tail tape measure protein n=1 Tax=Myoviridae sp. ct0Tg8 TaxID=2826598 RepID=A0A8S5NBB1_9CAUD|nr:tape measure protein [uncultured Prevotella sp.]DAD92101.1 MAG TPA: tail tape measure protein [Myoviridae sp. ct0Tg8]
MSNGKTVAIEIELLDRISGGLDRVNKKMDALTGGSDKAKKGLSGLENMSDRLKQSLMGLGMAFSMKGIVSEVANVRGQFQKLEVAFNTMLGSADKAEALMAQLVRTAAITPFDLEGVAQGAKQLLAYGMEAENVNETLTRLGDIAAGLSMPLNDLVYLYGTTMAQGRLYTQDLNQFTGRGIPMIEELAKVFGVAESKVKDLVEAGRVGFPEVQKVIENLTGEGSKFGGLMEEQSKTITGQISNIKDGIASMFNDMGKQSEGVINTALSGVTYMVEHYEQMGRVLMGLVATYGTYRTACMTVAAVHSLITVGIGGMTAAEAIHYGWIVMVEKAQKLLNATMLSNPYVLVATAIAGVVAMMISMKTETELIRAADEAYEAQKQKVIEAEEEHKRKMEELCSIAGDEALSTDTRREALNRLEQKYPSIFAKYDTEYEKLRNIKKIKQEIAELEAGQSIAKPKNELGNVNKRIQELEAKQKTERWKMSYGSYRRVGGLSRKEEAELKSLQQRQQNLNKQVRKDAVNAYFEHLTGVSNGDLQKQIKERENLMARMKMSGKKYGYTTNDGKNIRGTYTMDELQYQLNKLKSEKNRRNEPRRSSSDWGAADRKAYQAALKEYNDFVRNGSNNLTKEEYDKKAKELKEKTELAKKEYDSRKAGTAKDSEKAEKDAAKAEAAEERRKQVKEKVGQELVALQRKNDKEEIDTMQEGLEKKLRQIENDYQAQKDAIDKQETAWKRDNKKAGIATEANGLTKGQTDAIKEANALNEKSRSKAIEDANKEALKEELLAMTDYLKEYGTIQEQKYAIAKEYAEKIKEANEEAGTAEEKKWKVKALEKQRDAAMGQADAKSLAMNIDWGATFDGVGNVLKDVARETLGKVEEYMKTAEFKALSAENKKTYTDLQAKLKQETGGESTSAFNFKIWDTIAENVRTYQESVRTLREKTDAHTQAVAELERAQQKLAEATDDASKEMAQKAVDIAQGKVETTAASQTEAEEASDKARKTLTDNTNAAAQGIKNFTNYLSEMSNGSLYGFANGMTKLITSLSKGSDGIGKSLGELGGKVGGIVGAILQILDALGDDPRGFIDNLMGRVSDAINNVVADLPMIVVDVVKDVGNILAGLVSGIGSWFGAGNIFGLNGNQKEVKKTIETLTMRTELLQNAIEDLTDVMEKSYGQKATDAYEQARRNQQETNANYLEMAHAQARYWNKHKSWGHYWKGFTGEQTEWIKQNVKGDFNGSIWSLSPEEMKKLLGNVGIAEYIKNTGKGGYGAKVLDKLQDYAAQAGKLEELTDSWRETVTQISFESMKDSFMSNLMDMKKGSKDFAEGFATDMQKALLSYSMEDLVNGKLKKLYDDWAKTISEKNGELTEKDIEDFNRRYDEIVAEGLKRRDEWAKVTGYEEASGTSQSAKAGGFSAMTQEQGTKLEGMFVSGLQHWSSMDERLETVAERMSVAESHLARIAENTGTSAEHLGEIKEEIRKIVRDGLKVK